MCETYRTLSANDGNQAFLMLDFVQFDLITSGLHMKLKDGLELLKVIRSSGDEKTKDVPFLVISSDSKEYIFQELEKSGATSFLRKPFKFDEIEKAVYGIFNPDGAGTDVEPQDQKVTVDQAASSTAASIDFHPGIVSVIKESTIEALGQYMVTAVAGEPIIGDEYNGDLVATINLIDANHAVEVTLIAYFPKEVACKVYEGIFGEVDMDQICGVVQELLNIIGGNLKPGFAELSQEVFELVHPGETQKLNEENPLNFDLGLPVATMDGSSEVDLNRNSPKLAIPFTVDDKVITLLCVF